MQYLSSYYWQQEECARTALVLQQLVYRKGNIPVLFACICGEADGGTQRDNRYFAEQWAEWFHSRMYRLVKGVNAKDTDKLLVRTEQSLRKHLKRIDGEIAFQSKRKKKNTEETAGQAKESTQVAGMVCVGKCFWMFVRGRMHVWLLNRRFERGHCVELCGDGQEEQKNWRLLSGIMETEVALLLTTHDFTEYVTEEDIKECLLVKELRTPEQCQRRLSELGAVAAARGGHGLGAVLLVTKETI